MASDISPRSRIKPIFLVAQRISDSDERQGYLQQACGEDSELRAAVDGLLAALDRVTSSPLDEAIEKIGIAQTELLPHPAAPEVMDISSHPMIGPYKLLEPLGEGGMGAVYMARQLEPVKRTVAIKLIKPGMDSKEVIARFEAERQALAMMDHPNIARILDAGMTDQGRPYFVMELVRGVRIDQYCNDAKMPIRNRLSLFLDVCRAVQHAHQKGIIHRDLKPSNILVTLHDGVPVSKVIDFGIAKALDQELTERTLFTRFSQLVGTPVYMSPEQAEMSGLDVDTRSDVYSLGVLLYELLAGVPPFDLEVRRQAGFDEIRRVIREDDPPRPSHRVSTLDDDAAMTVSNQRRTDRRNLSFSIRRELDWIVMKALEKNRDRRYDSTSGLANDIQRYLDDEPVQACPPSVVYVLKKRLWRHRLAVGGAAVLLIFLLFTCFLSLWQVKEVRQAWQASQEREQRANDLLEASRLQTALATFQRGDLAKLNQGTTFPAGHAETASSWDSEGSLPRFLSRAACPAPRRVFSHPSAIFDLNVTPDGLRMVSVDGTGQVRLWDLTEDTGGQLLGSHHQPAHAIAISPDGTTAVSGATKGDIWFWDLTQGRLLKKLNPMETGIETLVWSPDGQYVAAGARYHGVLVLNAHGENQFKITKDARFESLLFTPDSKRLLVPTREDIDVWDVSAGKQEGVVRVAPLSDVRAMCWAGPNKKWLVVGERFSELLLVLERKTGKRLGTFSAGARYAQHLSGSDDGQSVLATYADGVCQLIELRVTSNGGVGKSGEIRFVADEGAAEAEGEPRWTARWLPGSDDFLTAGSDGRILWWTVDGIGPFREFRSPVTRPDTRLRAVFPLPPRELGCLFSGGERYSDTPFRFDYFGNPTASPGERIFPLHVFSRVSENGLIALGSENRVVILSLDSGRTIASVHSPYQLPRTVSLADSGNAVAVTSGEGELAAWCTTDQWRTVRQLGPWRSSPNQSPALADGGRTMIAVDENYTGVTERELEHGNIIRRYQVSSGRELRVSHQEHMLAMKVPGGIRVLERESKRIVLDGRTHSNATLFAFLPDDRSVVSAHEDGSIRAWHLPTGQSLGILYKPPQSLSGAPTQLHFADQATRLIVCYDDGKLVRAMVLGSLPPLVQGK